MRDTRDTRDMRGVTSIDPKTAEPARARRSPAAIGRNELACPRRMM
jgi:hypothetical protein